MKQKERNSNFELMRIVSMFLIIVWHFIMHTHLISRTTGELNFVIRVIYLLIAVHVNSFVLVSGYFQYNKDINSKKIFSLIGKTWFYKLMYALIFVFFGIVTMSKFDFFFFLQPLNITYSYGEFYWFINIYICLYLLIPYLNILIKNLSYNMHKKLIIILFILLSIIPRIALWSTMSNHGTTLITFIMLYLIGAFFGKYKLRDNYHFKYYSIKKYKFVINILFIITCFLSVIVLCSSDYLRMYSNTLIFDYFSRFFGENYIDFATPLIVIESVLYLLIFESINIKSKIINKIGTLTFGIYLVHENKFLFDTFYNWLPIGTSGLIFSKKILILIIAYSLMIFMVSAVIEYIRQIITKAIIKIYKKLPKNI
ncbi:MAG: acyltransferase family protein [Bacilli bacterium]|nr:acyltransferase family protein [Bacilli bacterium]